MAITVTSLFVEFAPLRGTQSPIVFRIITQIATKYNYFSGKNRTKSANLSADNDIY